MRVIPAIDLREGRCVQLIGGAYDREAIRLDDPVDVARRWSESGFGVLHIVDLDAATGRGSNRNLVRRILESVECETQVGGGVRESEDVDDLLSSGADRVIVGTRALEDPDWISATSSGNANRVIVAVDIRERVVVTHGWSGSLDRSYREVVADLGKLPLAGLLVTAVHREGLMSGTDLPLMKEVIEKSALPVQASGGITTIEDLRALKAVGVADVIIGMALYTGALDQRAVIEEFNQ